MKNLLVATFDKQEPQNLFWRYVDHIINIAATAKGIVLGIDKIMCSVDAFCKTNNINDIPPLYRKLLSHCGMYDVTCAKYIHFYKDAWLTRFPNGLTYKTELSDYGTLQTYREYLTEHELEYELALLDLYMKSI